MLAPQAPLIIYEIRCPGPGRSPELGDDPESRFGPDFLGLHLEADFAFIFFSRDPEALMTPWLANNPQLKLRQVHRMTYGQWQDGAQAEPFKAGGLIIAPFRPNEPPPAVSAGESLITIDPGLAFGFGGHPTTRACLELLSRAVKRKDFQSGLDLGCGTGILSLAAARLTAGPIVAVDYSHLAARNARRNVALNGLESRIEVRRGAAQDFSRANGELLLANIHFTLQKELLSLGAFLNRRAAVLSGLFPAEGEQLAARLARETPLKLIDQIRTDRWTTLFMESPE